MNNRKMTRTLLLAVMMLLGIQRLAPAQIEAVTEPRDDRRLAFGTEGKVAKVYVERGDHVKAGQTLMELDDRPGAAMVREFKLRVASDIAVRLAEEQHKLAVINKDMREALAQSDAEAPFDVLQARTEAEIRKIQVQQAKEEQDILKAQLERWETSHDRNILRAPIDGIIDEVVVKEGESVQQEKPVIYLVVPDVLRIKANVATSETLKLKVGAPAWVRYSLTGHDRPVQGEVVHLSLVADPASDTRRVFIDLPNPDQLPAGMHVLVTFDKPADVAMAD